MLVDIEEGRKRVWTLREVLFIRVIILKYDNDVPKYGSFLYERKIYENDPYSKYFVIDIRNLFNFIIKNQHKLNSMIFVFSDFYK